MYNDTIKVANKIISYDDLTEIFSAMNEKLIYYKKVFNSEQLKNKNLPYENKSWTFKDGASQLTFKVDFYDDTYVKFDSYNNFISIFNTRLVEIKSIDVYFSFNYDAQEAGEPGTWYSQHIYMYIYEKSMNIDVALSSNDKKIDDIYQLIKDKILRAPEKYDMVIKKKQKINNIVTLAIGLIPGLIISSCLLFIPLIKQFYFSIYITYPVVCLLISFLVGGTISSSKLDKPYSYINPE